MNKKMILILLCLCLIACQQSTDNQVVDNSAVLATVGEDNITETYLDTYLLSQGIQEASNEQSKQALDELVQQFALANQAQKAGLTLNLQQQLSLDLAKKRSLAQAAIQKHLVENPVTEADMQAEYQRITAELAGVEYHVRHLLFQDEGQAIEVLDNIKAGSDYVTEEMTYLADNAQVRNVGDIGWVNLMQVPAAFRNPLKKMVVDSIHPHPLVSEFGVHVLYLDGKRALDAPNYETVKTGIKQTLEQKKVNRYRQLAVVKSRAKRVGDQ